MASFKLSVVTPESSFYEGEVNKIVVRTTEGDVGILANHINYVAALGIGGLNVFFTDGSQRVAAISGGFMQVSDDATMVVAQTCEWADEIDINRAREAKEHAQAKLKQQLSEAEQSHAEVKLKKAINRIRVAEK